MNKIDTKIDFLKKIYKASVHPTIIFDENKKIYYQNEKCQELFENPDREKNIFFELLIDKKEKRIPLSELSLNEIIKKPEFCIVLGMESPERCFQLQLTSIGKKNRKEMFIAMIFELTSLKEQFLIKALNSLVNASLIKDNETGNHIVRINEYCQVLTTAIYHKQQNLFPEITEDFIKTVSSVASMHDIGKIGVPDYILLKPDKLSPEEFEQIKEHTVNGAFILAELSNDIARDIALFHHEKWDGSGYPFGIAETEIPLAARIVALADVYDALRMPRYYKKAFTHEEAINIMQKGRGTHFQKELYDIFEEIQEKIKEIYETHEDDEEIRPLEQLNGKDD